MTDVVARVRAGGGPVLVEATTYRWHGHYEGDPERYRSADEVRDWQAQDPLLVHAARAAAPPASTTRRSARSRPRSRPSSTTRVEAARALPSPDVSTLHDFVRARNGPCGPSRRRPQHDAPVFRTMDAIRSALEVELASDERVFVAGIDVGAGGNVFGLTRGLHEQFPDRVRDTPISETAVMGARRRRGDGRDASRRRDHVPRLRRRVPRPVAEPGGQAPVHDRRRRPRWR